MSRGAREGGAPHAVSEASPRPPSQANDDATISKAIWTCRLVFVVLPQKFICIPILKIRASSTTVGRPQVVAGGAA